MPSKKCPACGLVNWPEAEGCTRCGSPFSRDKPPVWNWYVAYCAFMAIIYLLVLVMGAIFLILQPAEGDMDAYEMKILGILYVVLGFMFLLPFAAGPFLPRKLWGWIFGLVLICIGMMSVCCWPATIPLLIFWLKPETKAYFRFTP